MFRYGPREGNGLIPKAAGEWVGARTREAAGPQRGRRLTRPCLLCVPSLGREQPRGQPAGLVAAAVRPACVSGLGRREEEEAAGAVLQGADAGVGAALPAAALPVSARARAAGAPAAPHAHAGQNLVPEPSLQAEARARAGSRGGARLGSGSRGSRRARPAAPRGGARAGARRATVRRQWRGGHGRRPGQERRDPGSRLPSARLHGLRSRLGVRPLPRLPALSAPRPGLLELVRQPRGAGTWGYAGLGVRSAAGAGIEPETWSASWAPPPSTRGSPAPPSSNSAPGTLAKIPPLLFPRPPDPELDFIA